MFARALASLALTTAFATVSCRAETEAAKALERPALGLMTTLPLLWPEAADVGEMLAADSGGSWVKTDLEQKFEVEPLDTLDEDALNRLQRLILAQPRALSPAENVALDNWVRRGGTLLLFADPMLTRHSRYPIGDRRRPQDVALLSPILSHWGLDLMFDAQQEDGERRVDVRGLPVPIEIAGSFRLVGKAPCELAGKGVLAECRIGEGRVVVLADAALLDDPEDGDLATRRRALSALLILAFD